MWTIGNLAAIPFEENRAKNASNNWDFYKTPEHKDVFFFDKTLIESINHNITKNEKMVYNFAEFCKERTNKIFNEIHNALFRHIDIDIKLNNEFLLPIFSINRKKIYERLRTHESLKNFELYYVDEETKTEIKLNELKVVDWSRRWISLGYPCVNEGFMISITSLNGEVYEIGLRTLPSDSSAKKEVFEKNEEVFNKLGAGKTTLPDSWWYWIKEVNNNVENEFQEFVRNCKLFLDKELSNI